MPVNFPGLSRNQQIGTTFAIINDTILQMVQTVNADQLATAFLAQQVLTLSQNQITLEVLFSGPATANQTVFTFSSAYFTGGLLVYSGGLLHSAGTHYVESSSTSITFLDGRSANEHVEIIAVKPVNNNPTQPSPAISVFNTTETPVGVIDSTDGVDGNGVFTLAHPIAPNTVPNVIISNMIGLDPATQFSWNGSQITINPGYKPIVGESVQVEYFWSF